MRWDKESGARDGREMKWTREERVLYDMGAKPYDKTGISE